MNVFYRILCFFLCLLVLGGSALAAEDDADSLPDRVREIWDSLDLADKLDLSDLTQAVRDLAVESAQLDDAALEDRIRSLAEEHGLSLNDAQVEQLRQLVRSIETGVEETGKLKAWFQNTWSKLRGMLETLRDFFRRAAEWFRKIGDWLDKLF